MPVKLTDLMLFKSVIKTTFTIDGNNNKYLVDKTLNELEEILITKHFFRVNRQIILNISAIKVDPLSGIHPAEVYLILFPF